MQQCYITIITKYTFYISFVSSVNSNFVHPICQEITKTHAHANTEHAHVATEHAQVATEHTCITTHRWCDRFLNLNSDQLYRLISRFAEQSEAFNCRILSFRAKTRRMSLISSILEVEPLL